MTWHWYNWWTNSKATERYQFLFHHIGFHIIRSRRRAGKYRPPAHIVNMSIPGLIQNFTICGKQFFFLVGRYINNYGKVLNRVWRDSVLQHNHTTTWKPKRKRVSKWFPFFRTEFPKWHEIVHGHYSKSDRKGLVDLSTMSAHIIREDGFNKLDDYWEEFIRRSPHLNSELQIITMEKELAYLKWKKGKRESQSQRNQILSKKLNLFLRVILFVL